MSSKKAVAMVESLPLFTPEVLHGGVGQKKLDQIQNTKQNCVDCGLCANRRNIVFGQGAASRATVAIVYGSPEANDDLQGQPMQNDRMRGELEKILSFLGVPWEQAFIVPVVACKAAHGELTGKETKACAPILYGQLRAVEPRFIITFGLFPAVSVLNLYKKEPKQVAGLYGEFQTFDGSVPVLPTMAIEALLGRQKKQVAVVMEEHLRRVRRRLADV